MEIELPRTSKRPDQFLLYAQPLGDLVLYVGQRTHAEREVRQAVLRSFGLAILFVLPAAVGAAFFLGKRAFRRVDEITGSINSFVSGALNCRVPITDRGDEFDRLSVGINAALQRIETLLDNQRQVTTDIAHDLRTPLGRLRQRLEAASSRREPDPNLASDAIEEIDGILSTFDSLLHIAEIDAGVARARFKEIDLGALAREVGDIYGSVAEDNGRSLQVDAVDEGFIRGDRRLLTQLLANLLENGIRHTPPGTAIRVAVSLVPDGIELTVADNGPGIPEGERARVFERFVRLEQSRTTPGSGLGLTLVKSICALHGGSIGLRNSEPGLQVTMRFRAVRQPISAAAP
jgi:signal transduction histidine kinase